jgi:hypothetical protein
MPADSECIQDRSRNNTANFAAEPVIIAFRARRVISAARDRLSAG